MKTRNRFQRFSVFTVHLLVILAVLLLSYSESAAFLHRVGPLNPAPTVGNFPAWYQDNTGLTLEFCDPSTASEVAGGWCLLLPGDVTIPEVFPTNFFDEHFYYDAGADPVAETPGSPLNRAVLIMALEAAFGGGPALPGDQIVFARIRVDFRDAPVSGTYRFLHPYGEEEVVAVAGDRIFITDDVGIACPPGDFSCALGSRLGPFLLPSNTPGGAEMPPLTEANPTPDTDPTHFPGGVFAPTAYPGTGKSYIADPNRLGPITGSPIGRHFFRIEGPAGSNLDGAGNDFLQTSNFSLVGRIFSGAIPGEVTVARANYTRNPAEQKVEVYAKGFETTQGRLPAAAPPAAVLPQLSFFDAPCTDTGGGPPFGEPAGATETSMFNAGNDFWAGAPVAPVPTAVCVKDNTSLTYFPKAVVDEVTVSQAYFNQTTPSLSVVAWSSDAIAPPTLTLGGFGDLTNGAISLSPLAAPPAKVQVFSSAGGTGELQVSTAVPPASITPIPATGVSLLTSLLSPQPAGAQVSAVAAASGGGTYEYQFYLFDGVTNTLVQPYSQVSTWTWNTTGVPAGTYSIVVVARSVGSAASSEAGTTINYDILPASPAATGATLESSPVTSAPAGTSVFFAATASGGGTYEYQFYLFDGITYTLVQPYAQASTWTWNTNGVAAGTYNVVVYARSVGSTASSEAGTTIIYDLLPASPAATGVTLESSASSPATAGTNVFFTAAASGGGTYEYQFYLFDGVTYTLVQSYAQAPTWPWNTTGVTPGSYTILVYTRSVGSGVSSQATASVPFDVN